MTKLRGYIGWLPINRLLIPGTHESLLVSQFRGYFANAVVRRWTYHQVAASLLRPMHGARRD